MYDEKTSDSDSSDSDGNEYYVVSKIKPSWLEDFKSGNFGVDFPPQKKMNVQKPIDVSKEFLNDILKKVRSKQNVQQPTQSVEAQNAISTIIGGNAPTAQQSNGGPSVVAQMTAVPTQDFQPQNIPRPYRPLVNNSSGNVGFEPNPNILPPNHNVPVFNQQPPIPNAASAYYQQPPAHVLMPNTNYFGHPIIQPILSQVTMPPQNGLPNSRFTQNVPQHHAHVHQPNMSYPNVPVPKGMSNVQRDPRIQRDPRLDRQTPTMYNRPLPPTLPPPTVPMLPPPPVVTSKRPLQKAATIDSNRRYNRISIDDYRPPTERAKARVEQIPDKNPVQRNGQVIPSAENVQTNGDDNEPEPTFSPTSITPASSPATEPSSGTPEPDKNNQNNDVEENNDVVVVKNEVIEETQNDDCDSDASDATVEFSMEEFERDRRLNMSNELDEDAATDIVGNLSPQYIAEEEIESEEPEPTNESEDYFIIDNEVEETNEIEDQSDSDDLLVPVPERPVALIDQTKRCFIILEDIGHLIKKYDRTRKTKKKTKAKRGRRTTRRFPSTTASDTEQEQSKSVHNPVNNQVKQEFEPEREREREPEPEPEPPVQEVVPVVEQVIDGNELSDIVISSDDENNGNNGNSNDNNNNTNNNYAVNPIVYEISSTDSDDE